MPRPHFIELPTGEARDTRRVAQVINSTRSGKLNAVGDFTIPDTTASPYTVNDPRVSEWSAVIVVAANASARTMDGAGFSITASDESFDVVYPTAPSGDADFRYVVIG
jgi:hypothetical protein